MYTKFFPIVPDDDNDLALIPRAIYVGGAGTVSVSVLGDGDDTPVNFLAVPAGTILYIRPKRVLVVASPATNLVGMA